MSSSRETLFQILCVGASLILLVMSLLYGVRVTALNQQAAAAKTKVDRENRLRGIKEEPFPKRYRDQPQHILSQTREMRVIP